MFTTMEKTFRVVHHVYKIFHEFYFLKFNIPPDLNESEIYYLNIKYNINKM